MSNVPIGFDMKTVMVPVEKLLPSKRLPTGVGTSAKYLQIMANIEEVGLIEPLSVTASPQNTDQHIVLDGHIRLIILHEMGYTEVPCLIASDDESYTYNNRLNRVTSIQEHHMIRRAIDQGVPSERLAKAFNKISMPFSKRCMNPIL